MTVADVRATIAVALAPPTNAMRLGDIELMPHQLDAVVHLRRALRRFGGALLADAVGLGKTYSALGVARDYGRVLVIHPASLRDMWSRALARSGVAARIQSYERLSRDAAEHDERCDLVILDEAHHVRVPTTRRFRRIARLTWGADVLLLSATPLHNRPRELVTLLSLFLGARAESLDDATLGQVICRRSHLARSLPLPVVHPTRWHVVPTAPAVLDGILGLPPPFRLADQGAAPALMRLSLIRHWCSSDAALRASLRLRLATSEAAIEYARGGRLPTMHMVRQLIADESTLQLDMFSTVGGDGPLGRTIASLAAYADRLRALLAIVAQHARDAARWSTLSAVLSGFGDRRAVVFTHSIATAHAAYRALVDTHRLACLTSRGARVANGTLPRSAVLEAFRPTDRDIDRDERLTTAKDLRRRAGRVNALITTDVLSEGVDLHDASLLVHLDLPWTEARVQQRVGRLRRLGSPHRDVVVEAFAPPAESEMLYGIVRRLAEKAGLAECYVGRPGDGVTSRGSGDWLGPTRSPRTSSAADRSAEVRAASTEWRESLDHGTTSEPSPHPGVACCAGLVPGFVAVIEDEQGPVIVAQADDEPDADLSADPAVVGLLLAQATAAELQVDPAAAARARARVQQLVDARAVIDGESRVMSATQLRTLRALRRAVTPPWRESRAGALLQLARVSDLVRRALGAGADLALAEWLDSLGQAGPTMDDVARLESVLGDRVRPPASRSAPRLTALLLVRSGGEPTDQVALPDSSRGSDLCLSHFAPSSSTSTELSSTRSS